MQINSTKTRRLKQFLTKIAGASVGAGTEPPPWEGVLFLLGKVVNASETDVSCNGYRVLAYDIFNCIFTKFRLWLFLVSD